MDKKIKKSQLSKTSQVVHEILEWIYAIIIALIIATFVHVFVGQITRVSGQSMDPTLHNGEYLLVSRWIHLSGEMPQYGNIVIIDSRVERPHTWTDDVTDVADTYLSLFSSKFDNKTAWVKRVIGLPGDTLQFKDGHVWRNGKELQEPYINNGVMHYQRQGVIKIPAGYIYVMGDNRDHSTDSRFIGPVPMKNILGKVVYEF